jgi:hypothetical protein
VVRQFFLRMETMLDDDSFFVIEEMRDSFKTASKRGKLIGPLDVHRRLHIARVHIVGFSSEGVYICRNFGQYPHYMISSDKIQSKVIGPCKEWNIPIKIHSSGKQVSTSDILCIWQMGVEVQVDAEKGIDTDSLNSIKQELDKLGLQDITIDKHKDYGSGDNKGDSLRGAQQQHFGYTSNHSLTRIEEKDKVAARPTLIGGCVPPEWKPRFVSMTKIGKHYIATRPHLAFVKTMMPNCMATKKGTSDLAT